MAASHVPKFGNWDGDNVPYTACFDNARRDKAAAAGVGGKMINPNDPEENPDAFGFMSPEKQARDDDYHSRSAKKSMSPSEESFSGHSAKCHRRKRSELKKKKNDSSNSIIPAASPKTPRNGRSNPYDDLSYRSAASVPKFGAWDEIDPKSSGEGYTMIFSKVKEEKQIAASKLPNVNQQHPTFHSTYTHKPSKSKMCCCLF
ncbi:PREDICTED: RPM1-interacting protein 4-like isoform X2 [Ipomoea nil]|uniref:RPM1-interacting protein 4-like isoform X2 n=1 Tax=Ipomoea nil TaxID=35883 RepID=UPI000900F271|nr:PREDICTED: RPM1-interacting protein 4-like isoform X2 [Ipomoea nil]